MLHKLVLIGPQRLLQGSNKAPILNKLVQVGPQIFDVRQQQGTNVT